MEGTTNINELGKQQPKSTIDESTMNELLMGIEKLKNKTNNPTHINSRDIPYDTGNVVVDPETLVNYVPKRSMAHDHTNTDQQSDYVENDYIQNMESRNEQYAYMESFYDDLQMPIFIGILFFVFQLPLVKKYLFYFFPYLFGGDGVYNLGGYIFTSVLFSLVYYILNKIVMNLNQ